MISKLAFLAGAATLVACQDPINPASEDLSADAQSNILAEVNLRREWHGTCNPLTWDQALVDDVKSWIVDGSSQCASVPPAQGLNLFNVWVTTFQITPAPVWNPATAAEEWYNSASGQAFENLVWNGATKIGCAQCRNGITNQGHMVFVYCKMETITGTTAENINLVNTTCDRCIGVTCDAPTACQQAGSCNSATGSCEYPHVADGAQCDDNDDTTTNDACTAGVCAGTSKCAGVTCAPLDPACADMGMCDPMTGQCIPNNKPNDTPCDDNNPATQNDKCVAGSCLGADLCATTPPCVPTDSCHLAGVCDPLTGQCTHPTKPIGTPCDDGDADTVHDTCNTMGMCEGINMCAGVTCQVTACVESSTCDPATGVCMETNKADGTTCDDNNDNTVNDACQSGACTGTDTGCGSVTCTVDYTTCQSTAFCIPQSGGQAATCGFTYRPVGAACGDGTIPGTKCTQVGSTVECLKPDLCANKQCTNDQCTEGGICDSNTGACSYTNKADGTTCDDNIAQTVNDACQAGVCVGENLCAHTDCHAHAGKCTDSQCDPNTGICVTYNKADGTACDDENDQTINDECAMGVCAGENKCSASQCTKNPPEQCVETQGSCDPATGSCVFKNKADNTPCDDGDANTLVDVCKSGVCSSGENCEVKLIRQFSKTPCVFGKTFGFTAEGKLYVTKGCRGKFEIVANNHKLKCASRRWKYRECDTFPLLPGCTTNDPEPCPTNNKCPGFTKLGDGNCVDSTGAQFNKASKTVKSKAECIQIARSHSSAISGVEYTESTKKCTVLVPAGISLPTGNWDTTNENNQGAAPVVDTDGARDVTCWVPEDRCLGVTCQALDDCHEVGVCEPQTGVCTNPEKSQGSWCNDGDATTWGDKCTNGVCEGSSGNQECWRANSWYGTRSCTNDPTSCNWGAGVYATEQQCCDKSFRNGCQAKPTNDCWVGGKHWPERTCKKITGQSQCGGSSGCWQTETECCAKGAAHREGCHAVPDDDDDDGVADRPEQCVCDENLFDVGMDDTIEDYCASNTSPNGNGHVCALPIGTGKCEQGFVFCRKAKSVPKSSGEVCACGALKSGARNSHTRLCVDRTTNGQNSCYPSNSNGACGMVQWSVCITKTSMTIKIRPGVVSAVVLVGHVSAMAGYHGRAVVSVVSSCRGGGSYGSRYAMRKGGCRMGGWKAPARHGVVLGDEEEVVTLEWDNLPSSAVADAEATIQKNMEIAAKDPAVVDLVLKNDPATRDAMKGFLTYGKPEIAVGPAVTDESEEEINGGDDSGDKMLLVPILGALAGLCFVATIVMGVMYKRRQTAATEYTADLVAHEEFTAEHNIALGKVSEKDTAEEEGESLRV